MRPKPAPEHPWRKPHLAAQGQRAKSARPADRRRSPRAEQGKGDSNAAPFPGSPSPLGLRPAESYRNRNVAEGFDTHILSRLFKKPNRTALDEAFRLETERVIGNDWVVRYGNRFLQVNRQGNHQAPAKGKVVVCEWPDGGWRAGIEGRRCGGRSSPKGRNERTWRHRARWGYRTAAHHRRRATRGNNATTGCRSRVRRAGRGVRKLFWRLPALRPKRSAYGLAGLRCGRRQNNWKRTRQKGHFFVARRGTF